MAALNWYIFRKKSGRLLSTGSKILTFGDHCSANFLPILDCFIPKFELEYDDLENIKIDRVNTVVFSLHQIKRSKFFLGHPVHLLWRVLETRKIIAQTLILSLTMRANPKGH